MAENLDQVWDRFRDQSATEADLKTLWAADAAECAANPAINPCPDFHAFMRPLIWQIERMDEGATMADALAVLIAVSDDNDGEVCRNGKPWAECNCC